MRLVLGGERFDALREEALHERTQRRRRLHTAHGNTTDERAQVLTELRVVDSMHAREQLLFDLSDGFVAFPGGFGTMEEIIEMITWKQMGIHGKPIVLANIGGYFQPLLQQFEMAIRHKFARTEDRILFGVAENTNGILTFLEGAPVMSRKAGEWA